jgi:hypothetical protein
MLGIKADAPALSSCMVLLVNRGFVLGRISDADLVRVDGAGPVGIRNPSPNKT